MSTVFLKYEDMIDYAQYNEPNVPLSDAEQAAIDRMAKEFVCSCGHSKRLHSRVVKKKFVGCQDCDCEAFVSSQE